MISIQIDKNKAIDMEKKKAIAWTFIGTLICFVIGSLIGQIITYMQNAVTYEDHNTPFFCIFLGSLIAMIIYEYVNFWFTKKQINSLEQAYDKNELMTRYEIIVKTKNTARLQVVNNVNITQDIWDKYWGLFNIEVDYGFGQEGYTHTFNYLDEAQAEKIAHLIKPRSKLGVNIK